MAVWLLVKRCVYILWNKVLWLTGGCTLLFSYICDFANFYDIYGFERSRHFDGGNKALSPTFADRFLPSINQKWLRNHI